MRELERRVERLEDEVRWLRRAVQVNGRPDEGQALGPCPKCGRGVLVRGRGELRCTDCGARRFL